MPSTDILNNLPALIGYWDRDLRNCFGNSAYLEWFGIDPDRMRGRHLREVIGEERFVLNLPYVEGVLAGRPQTFERMIPSPDGQVIRHALANYIPDEVDGVVVGFYVLVTDITPAITLRAALEASEQRYREIVEDQTEVICRFSPEGHFLFVNEVYCRLFGKKEAELLGRKWTPVCHPEDVPFVEEKLAALSESHPVVLVENRVQVADGSLRWMQFVNRGFYRNGMLTEIQAVGRDITDRKLAELALQSLNDQQEKKISERTEALHRMTVEATLAEARERESIARDLHDDIGQLLHVAKIRLERLHRSTRSKVLKEGLLEMDELIEMASKRVRSLTAQLSPPVLESLGLVPALAWLADQIAGLYGLRVVVRDDGLDKPLAHDKAVILFRAARELLINVVKHANSPEAWVTTCNDGGLLIMTVEDRGVGIPQDVLRLDSSGFGLRSLMERVTYLGGKLDICGGECGGAVVAIRVPLDEA